MNPLIFLFLAAIFAGFALIKLPLAGTALYSLQPIVILVGIVVILVFAFVIIFKAFKALFQK
ncbi:hypothetical protein JOC85_002202 [Bacillus mesophilus]|uniref:DUF3955 domain-containing protein n=1 Tax=Bacillus mesophilus TaxID=1808955 RepID=A0A6M0Q6V8_9BACI|nr:hypothetical protein [Bacillus mesophilus]MBM7661399.1 hypothetical protein [Bacillus mesophilus]NEY72072.1 hypothetical protein [Bacillus mesophilus]